MNTYNKAFNYLKKKYGGKKIDLIPSKRKQLKMCNTIKARKKLEETFTDDDYIWTINDRNIIDHTDKTIKLLMGQYYLGSTPKKELKELMENL